MNLKKWESVHVCQTVLTPLLGNIKNCRSIISRAYKIIISFSSFCYANWHVSIPLFSSAIHYKQSNDKIEWNWCYYFTTSIAMWHEVRKVVCHDKFKHLSLSSHNLISLSLISCCDLKTNITKFVTLTFGSRLNFWIYCGAFRLKISAWSL